MARRSNNDDLLAGAVRALLYIVNLRFPHEGNSNDTRLTPEERLQKIRAELKRAPWLPWLPSEPLQKANEAFLDRARHRTEKYWPELWMNEPGQVPPGLMLHRMRTYLQRFWLEQDDRARDWHIHRAREFYQDSRVLRATRSLSEQISNAAAVDEARRLYLDWNQERENTLDEPPPRNEFEDALFELQERARFPSTRPLRCPNCVQEPPRGPFFLSPRKGTKYCTPECAEAAQLASKRRSWSLNKHNWRF
jgi:hypothetical protein